MVEEVVLQRYPQLLFLLRTMPCKPRDVHKLPPLLSSLIAQKTDLLLCVGIPSPKEILALTPWLKINPSKEIMIFEEELGVIRAFCDKALSEQVFAHPQIQIKPLLHAKKMSQALLEAVYAYPVERVMLQVLDSRYDAEELSLLVLRRATITSALFHEDAYYHLLFRNLLPNFQRLPSCFYADLLRGKFQGIPAIVCGAGPSLTADISLLRKLQTKALMIAGGSTLAALSSQGVVPHLGLALDPNPEEYDRLKANQGMQVPMLFGSRVAANIFRTCNGPLGYMRTFSGGFAEQALEERLGLEEESLFQGVSQEGLSVTVMCFATALRLGCSPILLSGIDLAYTDGKRYAQGVVSDPSVILQELGKEQKSAERLIIRKNRHGKDVHTMVKWVMEAAAIEEFATYYPHVTVVDCVKEGLGFLRFPYQDLQEASATYLTQEYDLYGYVHQVLQGLGTLKEKQKTIEIFVEELFTSSKRCLLVAQKAIALLQDLNPEQHPEEDGKLTLCTMDFTEEIAFVYLLEPMEEIATCGIERAMRHAASHDPREVHLKKWNHYLKLLQHYNKLFEEQGIAESLALHHDHADHYKS